MESIFDLLKYFGLFFTAFFLIWRFSGFSFHRKFKGDKNEYLKFTISIIFWFCAGLGLRWWIEKPTFLALPKVYEFIPEHLEGVRVFFQYAVYMVGIVSLIVAFYSLVYIISKLIFRSVIVSKWEKLKVTDLWKEYEIFTRHLEYKEWGLGRELRLNKEGILKYSKNQDFKFTIIDNCERGTLIFERAKYFTFIFIAVLIFFPLAFYFYDDLFSFKILGIDDFIGSNSEINSIRQYWLITVWGASRFLILGFLFIIFEYLYTIWRFYYGIFLNPDD